jgi:hypothetical protein
MPDGDKVHTGLALIYQKSYKQICDGQFGGRELADEVISAVWKNIQKDGDKFIPLFQQIAEQCKQIQDRLLFEEIDWQQEIEYIDELSRPSYASKRAKSLAVEACKEQVRELRYGATASNYHIEILNKYMWNVYKANFTGRLPLTPSYYQGVSLEYVNNRLETMRPFVEVKILQYAEQIYHDGTVLLRRRPPRLAGKNEGITKDTDVFTIGV